MKGVYSKIDFDSMEGDEKEDSRSALRIGDKVSIFSLDCFGFLRGDGFVHDYLTVEPLDFQVCLRVTNTQCSLYYPLNTKAVNKCTRT